MLKMLITFEVHWYTFRFGFHVSRNLLGMNVKVNSMGTSNYPTNNFFIIHICT